MQAFPQLPQFFAVLNAVSQPVDLRPSQLPQPELQPLSSHSPLRQVDTPLGNEQTIPQALQLVGALNEVSQPLDGLPSQLAQPALQSGVQSP